MSGFYGEDLAAVHASGFTEIASGAAAELITRLPCRSRIVEFGCDESCYHRSDETHRLGLHRPADVLARLRRSGFTARTLRPGYGATTLPAGLTAYLARRSGTVG